MENDVVNILIADGNAIIRNCIRQTLEMEPRFRICSEAGNGLEALHLMREHKPQVALIDARMERMDGFEVARLAKDEHLGTRVLMFDLYAQTRAKAMSSGADAYLTKDSSCEVIRGMIYRLSQLQP